MTHSTDVAKYQLLPIKTTATTRTTAVRRQKSLSFICERFCALYKDRTDIITIDEAGTALGVQRRRMYEILNIMSSVGLVSREKTSSYRWEGDAAMRKTLRDLKARGLHATANQEETRIEVQMGRNGKARSRMSGVKRKAVATCLSERFIQIFVCNEYPQPIVLEDITSAFAQFFGDQNNDKHMSKGRRLYDIANVFCTLKLVRKSVAIDAQTKKRKRLYTWCGPSLDENDIPPTQDEPAFPVELPIFKTRNKRVNDDDLENVSRRYKKQKTSRAPLKPIVTERHNSMSFENSSNNPQWFQAAKDLDSEKSAFTTWVDGVNSLDAESTPVSSLGNLNVSSKPMTNSTLDDLASIEARVAGMESTLALRAEVGRLIRALEKSEQRENELLQKVHTQESEINKLIQQRGKSTNVPGLSNSVLVNSPMTSSMVFTPYSNQPSTSEKSKNAPPRRSGPFLPCLEQSPSYSTTSSSSAPPLIQVVRKKSSHDLITQAATSLLSLTPNKTTSLGTTQVALSLPTFPTEQKSKPRSNSTSTRMIVNAQYDSPSQSHHFFDALSPLQSGHEWDDSEFN